MSAPGPYRAAAERCPSRKQEPEMRSRASVKGDPIHAAIVHFPIAFLVGAALMDVCDVVRDWPDWWVTTSYALLIAGIVTALVAAVPGFIDYLYTVPPGSSARSRATKHMIVNLTAVVLFSLAWFLRGDPEIQPEHVIVATEAAGAVLLCIGGLLGGRLVVKNQIGVDNKYASNGRWREISVGASGEIVASADELVLNQMKLVRLHGKRIVIARTETGYVAFDDHCTHRGGSLAGGAMICGTVQCPWHGSQFDVRTGEVKCGPAEERIDTYRVEESAAGLRLHLS
jgi:nitrite reductase/ring-hydroxylating ferredoxin subunit/uncharacterized membrane protein